MRHILILGKQDFGYIFPEKVLAKWMSIPTLEGIIHPAKKSPLFWFPSTEQLELDKSPGVTMRGDFDLTLGDPPVEFIAVENVFYPVICLEDILTPWDNATSEDRQWAQSDTGKLVLIARCQSHPTTSFGMTVDEQIQRVQKYAKEGVDFWAGIWKKNGFKDLQELLADGIGE